MCCYRSYVFIVIRQEKELLARFIWKTLLMLHPLISLFFILALSVNLFTLPHSVNAQSTPSTFQPTRSSIYGTFHDTRYKNPLANRAWSYWQDNNYLPPNNWFSKLVQTWTKWGEGSAIEGGVEEQAAAPVSIQSNTFTFAAGGDIGANPLADVSLRAISPTGASFFLALGDMDYDQTPSDAAWCDYVKQRVGSTFPFEIVTGNHEEGSSGNPGPDGYIGNHAACLPDYFDSQPVIPNSPAYPANYYFDYPQANPIMRVIMISANLSYGGIPYNFNLSEQINYNALAARIDEAKQVGMWVVVGMHKVCLTVGAKSCAIGADLMNLLIQKKVDLVLHGHDHNYQRSKQIALGTSCASVAPGSYNSNCVVDDGSDNIYRRGVGTLFLINGNVGRCCYSVTANDSEANYFATTVGASGVDTNGFVVYTVSASRIDARVVNTVGTWSDSFSIEAQPSTTVPPRNYFTTRTPTLTWNRVSWAIRYQIQVANNNSFTGATIYPAGNNLAFTLPSLSNGTYFWRVAACSTTISCGGWSEMDSFVVEA